MSDDSVDLNAFIVSQCEAAYRWVEGATDGLTEEQLYYQPTPRHQFHRVAHLAPVPVERSGQRHSRWRASGLGQRWLGPAVQYRQ